MSLTLEDLRVKAVIAAALVWLTVVAMLGAVAVPRMRSSLVDATEEQLQIRAVSMGAEIGRILRGAVRELESISTIPGLLKRDPEELRRTLSDVERSSAFYERLTVVDRDGTLLAGMAIPDGPGGRSLDEPTVVGDPRSDATLYVSTVIRNSAGLPTHVLIGTMDLDDATPSVLDPVSSSVLPDRWRASLTGANGEVLARSGKSGAGAATKELESYSGSSRIEPTGWSVVVDVPKEAVIVQPGSLFAEFFFPVGLGTAAILLGAFVLVAGPAGALVQLSDALVRYGRGRDPERVRVRGSGQIATAQRAFNQMVEERERAEATLRERNERLRQTTKMEAVGRLAGGVAHDFNNVLTVVLGYTDFVLNDFGDEDSRRTKLETIRTAAERGADVTRRLLTFSRQQIVARRVIAVNEILSEVAKMLRPLFGETIRLELSTTEEESWVLADEGELSEMLVNLSVNARDAMPGGGTLRICSDHLVLESADDELARGPYVVVRVEDTGVGMEDDVREHVFEPFFSTKEVGKGTGLGLSMVLGVAQDCGGTVRVVSTVGEGTRFDIYLPRVDAPAPVVVAEIEEPFDDADGSHEATILVVEDEAVVLSLAAEILTQEGYRVLTASDATLALHTVRSSSEPIDLVITDIVMPGMNGRDLASQLRREHEDLKVIFVSGYTDGELMDADYPSGPQHFVAKPFAREDLLREVRTVVYGSGRVRTSRESHAIPPPPSSPESY